MYEDQPVTMVFDMNETEDGLDHFFHIPQSECRFTDFTLYYGQYHLIIITIFCVLGLCGHAVVVATLSRKSMLNVINVFMIGLSISQATLLTSYLVFSFVGAQQSAPTCNANFWSKGWVWTYSLANQVFLTAHSATLWLMVTISLVRVVGLSSYGRLRSLTKSRAVLVIVSVVLLTVAVTLPASLWGTVAPDPGGENYMECIIQLEERNDLPKPPTDWHSIRPTFLASSELYMNVSSYLVTMACKAVPCAFMLVLTLVLILQLHRLRFHAIKRAERRHAKGLQATPDCAFGESRAGPYKRTTRLIIVVMVLFLSVEGPNTCLLIYMHVDKANVIHVCFRYMLEFIEMLTILYNSINFAIFCLMSAQFRDQLGRMCRFCCPFPTMRGPNGQMTSGTTLHQTWRSYTFSPMARSRNDLTESPPMTLVVNHNVQYELVKMRSPSPNMLSPNVENNTVFL